MNAVRIVRNFVKGGVVEFVDVLPNEGSVPHGAAQVQAETPIGWDVGDKGGNFGGAGGFVADSGRKLNI